MNGFSGKDEEILMVRASELEPETYWSKVSWLWSTSWKL